MTAKKKTTKYSEVMVHRIARFDTLDSMYNLGAYLWHNRNQMTTETACNSGYGIKGPDTGGALHDVVLCVMHLWRNPKLREKFIKLLAEDCGE